MITVDIRLVGSLVNFALSVFIYRTLFLVGFSLIIVNIAYNRIEQQKDDDVPIHLVLIDKKYTAEYVGSKRYEIERKRFYRSICGTRPEVRCSSEGYSHIDFMNHKYDDVFIRHARLSKNQ